MGQAGDGTGVVRAEVESLAKLLGRLIHPVLVVADGPQDIVSDRIVWARLKPVRASCSAPGVDMRSMRSHAPSQPRHRWSRRRGRGRRRAGRPNYRAVV